MIGVPLPGRSRITNPRGEAGERAINLPDTSISTNYTDHDDHDECLQKMPQGSTFTTYRAKSVGTHGGRPQLQLLQRAVATAIVFGLPRPIMARKPSLYLKHSIDKEGSCTKNSASNIIRLKP